MKITIDFDEKTEARIICYLAELAEKSKFSFAQVVKLCVLGQMELVIARTKEKQCKINTIDSDSV
jgi:hypothetical protein